MVPYLFTAVSYSLRCRHNSRDVPMCHSFVAILRTFHNSPKRQRFFELVLDAYISEPHVKIKKSLCKTRWVERHDCLERFYNLYGYIIACLDAKNNPTGYPNL